MAKTIEQIFESREKADRFHEEWQTYHDKLEKRASNRAILFGVLIGIVLPLFIYQPITNWVKDQGYPPIVYILIFAGILLILALMFWTAVSDNLYKWVLDKKLNHGLESLCHGFTLSHETELKESVKIIETNTDRIQVKIKYHKDLEKMVFDVDATPKIRFLIWIISVIVFAFVAWFVFIHLGIEFG